MARSGQTELEQPTDGEILAREILVSYPQGLFPMSQSRTATDYDWYLPEKRGVIPLDGFHVSRSLARYAKQNRVELQFAYNLNFETVIDACAARETTWIGETIREAFLWLHDRMLAHSAEVYIGGRLAGGVYGLALGGAFFGESMFSRQVNGSKLALGAMIHDLRKRGFKLYDTQFLTSHLASLGGIEIPAELYAKNLEDALRTSPKPIPTGAFDAIDFFIR